MGLFSQGVEFCLHFLKILNIALLNFTLSSLLPSRIGPIYCCRIGVVKQLAIRGQVIDRQFCSQPQGEMYERQQHQ